VQRLKLSVDVRRLRIIATLSLTLLAIGASDARATTLQPLGNFEKPTYLTSDPGDANRLFVTEREGTIELVDHGVRSDFVDLSSKVSCCEGERGLLSMALDPEFDANGRLYVDYTGEGEPGEIHVAELVAEPDRKTASPATLRTLLTIPHSGASNHNGGQLQFGPDGDLYISTGDGGGSDDQFHNAQDLESGLGKILRIRPDPEGAAPFYTVAGNPFAASGFPKDTIWSYGLRNPYRFSFDSLSGDMVIGDVGQGQREEIDFAPSPLPGVVGGREANYGWNCREGFLAGPGGDLSPSECAAAAFTEPAFDYPHTPDPDLHGPSRCAIIGGYVVRDPALGALYGQYLYADFCSGAIRAQQLPTNGSGLSSGDHSLGLRVAGPVSFGEDSAHRLYVVEEGGQVYCLAGLPTSCSIPAPSSPTPESQAQPKATFVGIEAQRRRVRHGKRALLTVFVSPCSGRRGQSIELLHNGHPDGTRYLSRACTARFLPRIRRGATFTAVTREYREYLPGGSRRLTIRLAHHRRHD
jgi:Glucose / Sorbosone dehydrogenase